MLVGDDDTVSVSGKKATLKVLEGALPLFSWNI